MDNVTTSVQRRTLESALKQHTTADPRAAVLDAQWEFDRRLLGQALASVAVWFPHYSLHDASHSATIVTQIERILGPDRISVLSPSDLWLILEAAYWHDSGMLVLEPEAREAWQRPETRARIEAWARSDDAELREAATVLLSGPDLGIAEWPFTVRRSLTLAIAELRRPEHATVSGQYVRSPDAAGIASPRTPLVPRRLLDLVAKIVEGHGRSFQWLLDHLPQRESGLGADEAHPRLVACLLRLGDLLDLDDGRFCPVMGATFGARPRVSEAHVRKHASIEHLLVDAARIEVTARCGDWDGYEVTAQWLGWLEDEIKTQAGRWADITCGPGFGALPSAGKIEARIDRGITLPDGKRPRFQTSAEAVRELAKGTNLYKNRAAFIRELLQNAVDATLLRVWHDHAGDSDPRDLRRKHLATDEESLQRLETLLKKYPVEVRLEVLDDAPGHSDAVVVRMEFEDHGIGICHADIPHILKVMGGTSTPARAALRATMPEWMWPSGTFGIGLQSVFLVAEEVEIHSLHAETLERVHLILRHDGGVEARVDDVAARRTQGTTVIVNARTERLPPRFAETPDVEAWMQEVDPLTNATHPPLHAGEWREAICEFASTTVVPIDWQLKDRGELIASSRDAPEGPPENRENQYARTLSLEGSPARLVRLTAHAAAGDGRGHVNISYRGAHVDNRAFLYPDYPFYATADLWFRSARELLTLGRDRLARSGWDACEEPLYQCLARFVDEAIAQQGDHLDASLRAAFQLSAKLRGASRAEGWRSFRLHPPDETASDTNGVTLGELVDAGDVTFARSLRGSSVVFVGDRIFAADERIVGRALQSELSDVLCATWGTRYRRSVAPSRTVTLQLAWRDCAFAGNRRLLAVPAGYSGLGVKADAVANWKVWHPQSLRAPVTMLSPFTGDSAPGKHRRRSRRVDRLSEYVRWTASASTESAAPEHVARLTWQFLCEVSKLDCTRSPSPESLEAARRELAALAGETLPLFEEMPEPEPEPDPPWKDTTFAQLFGS